MNVSVAAVPTIGLPGPRVRNLLFPLSDGVEYRQLPPGITLSLAPSEEPFT